MIEVYLNARQKLINFSHVANIAKLVTILIAKQLGSSVLFKKIDTILTLLKLDRNSKKIVVKGSNIVSKSRHFKTELFYYYFSFFTYRVNI